MSGFEHPLEISHRFELQDHLIRQTFNELNGPMVGDKFQEILLVQLIYERDIEWIGVGYLSVSTNIL